MRQLNKLETWVFLTGGILMAIGVGCCVFLWHPRVFSWVYLIGALMFVAMQARQRYDGSNSTIKRLRKIMLASGVFFIVAGLDLVETNYRIITKSMSYISYLAYIYNKWVMFLLAGAILQLYSTHRISNELQKE